MKSSTSYKILLIYLFFEYGRPQAFFPVLGKIHPGYITLGLLSYSLVSDPRRLKGVFQIKETKFFLALILLMIIHILIAVNNYWAFQVWRDIIIFFIAYLSIITFIDDQNKFFQFIVLWLLINAFCAANGILNGGRVPNSAFMGDENDFALVMNMAIPLAYFNFLSASKAIHRLFYISMAFLYLFAVISSFSRGGFVGLVVVGFFCWLKSPRRIMGLVIVSLAISLIVAFAPQSYWKEIKSIETEANKKGTGYDRWYMWRCGIRMFLDNPVIGVGQGNFPWNIARYEPKDVSSYWHSHAGRPAHSVYITLLSELGLVGSILLLVIVGSPYVRVKKVVRGLKLTSMEAEKNENSPLTLSQDNVFHLTGLGLLGALWGYLISGIFLSVLYYPHVYLLTGLMVAFCRIYESKSKIIATVDARRMTDAK